MASIRIAEHYIAHAETIRDKCYVKASLFVRIIARVCLLMWFIDDNLWKCLNWSFNLKFVSDTWGYGYFVMGTVVLINIVGVFVGCLMILLQKKVLYACGFLLYVILFQKVTLILASFWSLKTLLVEFSVVGSLIMILAESEEAHSHLSGGTSSEEMKRRSVMQLSGRCLVVLIFIATLQNQRPTLPLILQDIMTSTLMALVTLGYRTKLSALVLSVFLTVLNFYNNGWWNMSHSDYIYIKYEFFQTMAVVGGLLMVTLLGPGSISVDEAKKQW